MSRLRLSPPKAQTEHCLVVNIPFEFDINGETLPPGKYILKQSSSDKPEILSIDRRDGRRGEFVLTSSIRAGAVQPESKLVFHRYGDRYFLSQVWEAGDDEGRELPKSRRERALERELAKNGSKSQTVAVIGQK